MAEMRKRHQENVIITDELLIVARDETQPRELRVQIFNDREIEQKAMNFIYCNGESLKNTFDAMIKRGCSEFVKDGRMTYLFKDGKRAFKISAKDKLGKAYAEMACRRLN